MSANRQMNLQVTPAHKVAMKDGNRCEKFLIFTGVHFSDLNPNSWDNLNNMKLELNVSTISRCQI